MMAFRLFGVEAAGVAGAGGRAFTRKSAWPLRLVMNACWRPLSCSAFEDEYGLGGATPARGSVLWCARRKWGAHRFLNSRSRQSTNARASRTSGAISAKSRENEPDRTAVPPSTSTVPGPVRGGLRRELPVSGNRAPSLRPAETCVEVRHEQQRALRARSRAFEDRCQPSARVGVKARTRRQN